MSINPLCEFCTARKAKVEHHLTPKSKGGTKTILLCDECHKYAHDIGTAIFEDEYLFRQNLALYGS